MGREGGGMRIAGVRGHVGRDEEQGEGRRGEE